MRKICSITVIALALTLVASCSKDSTTTTTGNNNTSGTSPGTYTFDSLTYTARHALAGGNILGVDDDNSMGTGTGTVNFYFHTYPTVSGAYQIVQGISPTRDSQVGILFTNLVSTYSYYGGPNVTGTATVTVASTGKINVTIAHPVTLVRQGLASDSGQFSASINQQ